MVNDPPKDKRIKPVHWLIPVIVAAAIAVIISLFGINDVRLSDLFGKSSAVATESTDDTSANSSTGQSAEASGNTTGPVVVETQANNGIDIRWTSVKDPDLYEYSVILNAISPIEFSFSLPMQSGDRSVVQRAYPSKILDKYLEDRSDDRRVTSGQIWNICVQGMRESEINEPVEDYILSETKACSGDFKIPE